MIKIINVSTGDSLVGEHDYELYINQSLICTFKHDRSSIGLAQCLRDAADAVDKIRMAKRAVTLHEVYKIIDALKNNTKK